MCRFVIVGHGRTGSSLMVEALRQHANIWCYYEVFKNSGKRPKVHGKRYSDGQDAEQFSREQIFRSPNEFDRDTVGFKLFFNHARRDREGAKLWDMLAREREIKIILMSRVNLFDCYVSYERSKRSDAWRAKTASDVPRDYLEPLNVDVSHVQRFFESHLAGIELVRRTLTGHPILEVMYEEISAGLQPTMDRVFQFLQVPSCQVAASLVKMNNVPHSRGIVNYSEIVDHFRYSAYRSYFGITEGGQSEDSGASCSIRAHSAA